jgi:hypothetical protein
MPMRARRRLRLGWDHHFGPWQHPFAPYGAAVSCCPPWWTSRPSRDEEKQALADYVAALKEELDDAEEHLKELEEEK